VIVSNLLTTQILGGFCLTKNKQGFEMRKSFIIAVAIAALPCMASAQLMVGKRDSDLGKKCWDAPDGTDGSDYRLIKCTPGKAISSTMYMICSDSYTQTVLDTSFIVTGEKGMTFGDIGLHCILGEANGAFYVCSQEGGTNAGPACKDAVEAAWNDIPDQEINWISCGRTGCYYREYYTCTQGTGNETVHNLNCTNNKEYVCDKGFYHSSGSGDSYTCSLCPDPGTSKDLNSGDITSCYIPSGKTFCDDTGCGKYTGPCYYEQ